MASYSVAKKNTAFKFYIGLVDQSNTKLLKANPTIASGDFKVSIDGGAFANLTTLPSANPASGRAVMVDLSASEMNGDNVIVQCVDASGAEWCDLFYAIQPAAAGLQKNVARTKFPFEMTDSTLHNPATGKTVTVTRSIDGGSFGAGSLSAVTEVASGMYYVDFAASDMNGDAITLLATATGCDATKVSFFTVP